MIGRIISMLVVLLVIAGYAVGTRYHAGYRAYQPGYGGRGTYYPGYARQSNTASYRIRPEDRNNSTEITTLPAEEKVKTVQGLRVNQTVEIRDDDKEESASEINHQIIVEQSVLQKIEHYHIQAADKAQK